MMNVCGSNRAYLVRSKRSINHISSNHHHDDMDIERQSNIVAFLTPSFRCQGKDLNYNSEDTENGGSTLNKIGNVSTSKIYDDPDDLQSNNVISSILAPKTDKFDSATETAILKSSISNVVSFDSDSHTICSINGSPSCERRPWREENGREKGVLPSHTSFSSSKAFHLSFSSSEPTLPDLRLTPTNNDDVTKNHRNVNVRKPNRSRRNLSTDEWFEKDRLVRTAPKLPDLPKTLAEATALEKIDEKVVIQKCRLSSNPFHLSF